MHLFYHVTSPLYFSEDRTEGYLQKINNNYNNNNNNENDLVQWTDTKTNNGFIRKIVQMKYYFNDQKTPAIYLTEGEYKSANFPITNLDYKYNDKIGALDFETYGIDGTGNQDVYAGGLATKNETQLLYINPEEKSDNLVKRVIESILINKKLDGYTFYAHNLGRFDSVFLIKASILMDNIKIKPIWKYNTIISISIKNTKLKTTIKLLDSMLLINGKLRYI